MTISLHTHISALNTVAATSVSPLDPSRSSKTKFSRSRIQAGIYQTVTDSTIYACEADFKLWSCPWERVPVISGLHSKYATGAAYSGVNIMLL